jgi:hypothetical protein
LSIEATAASVGLERNASGVYNEAAFRYFLARERRRAARSQLPLMLILVSGPRTVGGGNALSEHMPAVFSALTACVREVDFVGWYRNGSIAAALLSVGGGVLQVPRQALRARVIRMLRQHVAGDETTGLRVRVIELGRSPRT